MGQTQDTIGPLDATFQARRMGIMGGSFDPVHLGHLLAAEQCREQLDLSQMRFIPAAVSPFKIDQQAAAARHRVEMLHLATSGHSDFVVDDREVRRGGTSFTVDTLRELRHEFPQTQLVFLMGADSLVDFDKWREPGEICRLAQVVVVARGGHTPPDMKILAKYLPAATDMSQHQIVMPECQISSTELRHAVGQGRSIRFQVPAAVAAYIAQHKLYQEPIEAGPETPTSM